jgi:hypothetical protein
MDEWKKLKDKAALTWKSDIKRGVRVAASTELL